MNSRCYFCGELIEPYTGCNCFGKEAHKECREAAGKWAAEMNRELMR